jgi:glycosyltransferase involved in cell wall biosynthesis
MKLGFVVPRYGPDIVGGAESLCRDYAERLTARGHHVEVFTTCARDHFNWTNALPAGDTTANGVRVHRYPISYVKDLRLVASIEQRISVGDALDSVAELAWVLNAGASEPLLDALDTAADRLDSLIFLPYLFATTCFGVAVRPERSIVVPCLHDEAYARFQLHQNTLKHARGLIFNSEGERQLAATLIEDLPASRVVGVGFDEPSPIDASLLARFEPHGDYVAYAGRREAGKNWPLLVAWMTIYSRALSRRGPATLVSMGSGDVQLPPLAADLVRDLGFVDERTKHHALAAATVTAQLSRNESFSYAIFESWLAHTPVVVHAHCPVTRGFCEASGGGLWAETDEDFAVILDELRGNRALRTNLADAGHAFVMERFRWPAVLDRLETALDELAA